MPCQPFQFGLGGVHLLADAKTRSICAENPDGSKGAGAQETPPPGEGPAGWLGQGWRRSRQRRPSFQPDIGRLPSPSAVARSACLPSGSEIRGRGAHSRHRRRDRRRCRRSCIRGS